ncbi:transcription and mRNA export factor ENY2-like [Centruroides vittatus]|uniref:transcription and mRNA export factor ENY2-like n=1 Tax=Centruroides vittatus TaxID=120091 RepID=UPI000C6DDBD3|nr:transcription and mRNA export factor ENY2-like isoform X1 [Centruroides sculpturatus]
MTDVQDRKLKDLQMKNASNQKLSEGGDRDSSQERKMRSVINQKLVESGERERLKELLRTRLVECGWRDQLKAYCKDIVKEKGVENVTVDDLVAEITPKGRELVPDSVKRELLQRIRTFLSQQANS